MEQESGTSATETKAPNPSWRSAPFDAVTNFSLLGWIMDKLIKGKDSQQHIDLRLEE